MRVLINHITRMYRGRICVAGLDLETDRHVRPILQTDLLHKHLACEGGLFEVGAVIDLGSVKPKPHGPHTEDVEFRWRTARRLPDVSPEEFWRRLATVAKPTLRELFGPELLPRGKHHAGVDEGHGQRSLGCLLVQQPPRLAIEPRDGKPRIRMWLRSKSHEFDLGVTDIRLYGSDHTTPNEAAVQRASEKLARARYDHGEVILSVGLTRASADWFTDQIALHWLQVNNLHFADEPYWRS